LIQFNVVPQDAYNTSNMMVLNPKLSISLVMTLKSNLEQVSSVERLIKTTFSLMLSKFQTNNLLKSKKKWVKYSLTLTLMVLSDLLFHPWLPMDLILYSIIL